MEATIVFEKHSKFNNLFNSKTCDKNKNKKMKI